jgi:hypothetical protein
MKAMAPVAAFPSTTGAFPEQIGMSLRDWFAGQALSAIASDPSIITVANITGPQGMAVSAYAIADAMLKEREK